jgi:hypothetical protein
MSWYQPSWVEHGLTVFCSPTPVYTYFFHLNSSSALLWMSLGQIHRSPLCETCQVPHHAHSMNHLVMPYSQPQTQHCHCPSFIAAEPEAWGLGRQQPVSEAGEEELGLWASPLGHVTTRSPAWGWRGRGGAGLLPHLVNRRLEEIVQQEAGFSQGAGADDH